MKNRDYYIHHIINDIKSVERINLNDNKPWNYRLKELGKHLVNKSYTTANNSHLDRIDDSLNHLNKRIDKLKSQASDPDFDKHPIMYTIDDSLGGLLIVTLIIGGIIACGLFFHLINN